MPENRTSPRRWPLLPLSPVILIRTCSVLFAGLMLGHMSGYPWRSPNVAQQIELMAAMKSVSFVFAGEPQTYWHLYTGWGILVAALLLSISIILWLISDLSTLAPRRIGLVAGTTSILSIVGSWISLYFFYIPPAIFFSVQSIVLLVATIQLLFGHDGHGGRLIAADTAEGTPSTGVSA